MSAYCDNAAAGALSQSQSQLTASAANAALTPHQSRAEAAQRGTSAQAELACVRARQPGVHITELPAELVNKIYREVLVSTDHIEITKQNMSVQTSVLRTCRQFRNEASSIFYDENRFFLTIGLHNQDLLQSWLLAIGPENLCHLHGTFSVAYEFSEAMKDDIRDYKEPASSNAHKRLGREKIWAELQIIWSKLAATLADFGCTGQKKWLPVIDWETVEKRERRDGLIKRNEKLRDRYKLICEDDLKIRMNRAEEGLDRTMIRMNKWEVLWKRYKEMERA